MSKSIIQGVTPEEKEFSDDKITWHKGVLLGIEKNTSWKYVTNLGINFKYCREQSNTAEDFIEQARIDSTSQQQFTSCTHCAHHASYTLNKCMMCIHFSLVDNFTPRKTSYSA